MVYMEAKGGTMLKDKLPIDTAAAPAAVGPYSQAIFSQDLLFVSGQIGLDPATGKLAGEDFETQARQAMKNMGEILTAARLTVHDVVSVDIYLMDMADFAALNSMYEQFMDGNKPARATIQVAGLPLGALVELRCIARQPEERSPEG
jgi:2-iminobutanoate/2-iminopropanoate deaminase